MDLRVGAFDHNHSLEIASALIKDNTHLWSLCSATMGNAVACKACSSDKALATIGSDLDLNVEGDHHWAADSGYGAYDGLVRLAV